MAQKYGAADGSTSDISGTGATQFNTFEYKRKALIETKEAEYFGMLGDTETLSKHYGQSLKKYHYLPLLDPRNINDQGIDASGIVITHKVVITVTYTLVGTVTSPVVPAGTTYTIEGQGGSAALALTDAQNNAILKWVAQGYTEAVYATIEAEVIADGGAGNVAVTPATATVGVQALYGGSKHPGYIMGKMPTLSETGGEVNRVGFKRLELEGDISDFGFYYEWSKDSMEFDTDKDLYSHINRESVRGAREITEDLIQNDLLAAAGVIRYTGDASSIATTGYNATAASNSIVTYDDLVRLGVTLDENRCPKDTKAITGSRDTDIKTIGAGRYMFIGSEMIPTLMRLTDYHSEAAFVPVKEYGNAGADGKYKDALHGEIGSVGPFRIIVVPEMMGYVGEGEIIQAAGSGYLNDGVNYNVYPMLAVGSGSFAHIRFQTSQGTADKFKIIVRKPGTFANPSDPFEKIGYSSIQFWQGTLVLRPEWIGVVNTLALG